MTLTIASTDRIVEVNGTECRVWEGRTERGVKIQALIPRIAVQVGQDTSQFEAELKETHSPCSPGAAAAFPLRMIL